VQLEHARLADLDGAAHQHFGAAAEQDLAGGGRLLEPRGDVDGVAGDERLPLADDDLAGVDADAAGERDGACRLEAAPSSTTSARISAAARAARSASSSWRCGRPNTATTASPMNFSTRPPCRSAAARTRAW
jgi:hypothetical protein